VASGSSCMTQGDHGVFLYVIESGSFGVLISESGGDPIEVQVEGPGACFGELALMYNAPRAATVTAKENSKVWKIDRYTFRRVAKHLGKDKLDTYTGFLNKVELLVPLTSFERTKIAEALDDVEVKAGAVIFTQGEVGDAMYIVKSGSVSCEKKNDEGAVEKLPNIGVGDYFGERALLSGDPRAATITAAEDCVLLKLDASAFHILLGPLEAIMKSRVDGYVAPPEEKEEAQENQKDTYKWEDLSVLGTLGQGSFGHVQLVKHEGTGKTFALKGVSKQQIVDTHQQGHIMSEKKVMVTLQHPFIIRLFATYKDANQLYFLLEPVLGGELFGVLRKCNYFKESTARFYAGSVILAFEYLQQEHRVPRPQAREPPRRLGGLHQGGRLWLRQEDQQQDLDALRHARVPLPRDRVGRGAWQGRRLVDRGHFDLRNAGQLYALLPPEPAQDVRQDRPRALQVPLGLQRRVQEHRERLPAAQGDAAPGRHQGRGERDQEARMV
jgi:CRP-like cAMP-binding protein